MSEGQIRKDGGGGIKFVREGIAYVKPNLIGSDGTLRDKWVVIEEMILDYTKLHSEEVREVYETAAETRQIMKNKDASMGKVRLRLALVLPVGLNFLIKRHFPEVLKVPRKGAPGQLHDFMHRFPMFTIPQDI